MTASSMPQVVHPQATPVPAPAAIDIRNLTHHFGARPALNDLSLTIAQGEICAILGPNGSGKTTLFRILSTLLAPQTGTVRVMGADVLRDGRAVRYTLGVVFQSPSLDKKLTVRENLRHHGQLYGLSGSTLGRRVDELLDEWELADRAGDYVETLSGGLARRVDLARGLLHRPRVLLLDEPSAGLDPHARITLRQMIERVRTQAGVTVVLTTHLLEEADKCDRVAILDAGRRVALGSPDELKAAITGECLHLQVDEPGPLAERLRARLGLTVQILDGQLRIEHPDARQLVPRLMEECGPAVRSLTLARPSLEEVFIHYTGHRLSEDRPSIEPGVNPS